MRVQIRSLKSAFRNRSTGPDADNELDDSQVVLRLRRFSELRCKQFMEAFRGFSCCITTTVALGTLVEEDRK
jgi:hypothetical protein